MQEFLVCRPTWEDIPSLTESLGGRVAGLKRSRLANEDTLAKNSMSQAERKWLRTHRTPAVAHWNLLTELKAEGLERVSGVVSTRTMAFVPE